MQLTARSISWAWEIGVDDEVMVKELRFRLDHQTLPIGSGDTTWNKCVPFKINVFILRMMLNRLPTRCNLVKRGIDEESVMCRVVMSSGRMAFIGFSNAIWRFNFGISLRVDWMKFCFNLLI